MSKKQKKQEEHSKQLDPALLEMSKEELVQALMEATEHTKELAGGLKMLLTHVKVLCHRNGGNLSYTKEEFNATAKDEPDYLGEEYVTDENGVELCVLKIRTADRADKEIDFNRPSLS